MHLATSSSEIGNLVQSVSSCTRNHSSKRAHLFAPNPHHRAQRFVMIIASEIGDKTFLIAAILAMRHPCGIVFAGVFGALAVMSVLSAALGHVLPTLIPRNLTQFAAAALFFVFGTKMLLEGREMQAGSGKIEEEMREAEEEIEEDDPLADGKGETVPLEELEGERRLRII